MDIIEQIKAEIERRKGICMAQIKANPGQTFPFVMEMTGYDKILSFLSTLESEHLADASKTSPKDLEEAAGEYEKKHTYQRYDGGGLTPEYDATIAEAFIAGAKWMAEHLKK